MLRILLCVAFCVMAATAHARCRGVDLRDHLSADQANALSREMATLPFAQGNHWIARKGGRSIHVIGTLHVNDPRFRAVIRTLTPVIKSADAVLLEVTEADIQAFWSAAENRSDAFINDTGTKLSDVMSKPAWDELTLRMRLKNISPQAVDEFRPWILSLMLSDSQCGPRGSFAHNGLDRRIEKIAQRSRIPLGSLETVGSSIALLSHRSLSEQARMLEYELLSASSNDNLVITIRDTYFDEQAGAGLILEKWNFRTYAPGSANARLRLWRNFEADMLTTRNKRWIPQILKTTGNNLVVAVGAGHLPGQDGVLNLLKRAGYSMERAAF